jgi:polyvinyl alcohol dehydrogenase (cytochrome)
MTDATTPGWNGWGTASPTRASRRFPRRRGSPRLRWRVGYAGVNAARRSRRSPAAASRGQRKRRSARARQTGCTHWTHKARAGIRTGSPSALQDRERLRQVLGDVKTNAYAVDAQTGRELWVRKVDDHVAASLTGAPTVSGGKVFVPVQGLNEEGQGGTGKYPCCTFRGSLVALDANTGAVLWKTYTVDASQRGEQGRHSDVRARGAASGRHRPSIRSAASSTSPPATPRRSTAEDDQRRGRDGLRPGR